MKVVCIGGGPGGLFSSILLKKAFPDAQIEVYERNRADDTFGWGVVFSDETLDNVARADPETYAEIEASFVHWTDIDNFYGGECVRSTRRRGVTKSVDGAHGTTVCQVKRAQT